MSSEDFMQSAIEEAIKAENSGLLPIASIITKDDMVIAKGWSTVGRNLNPAEHNDLNCISEACSVLNTLDLSKCTLYSTIEPCPMCISGAYWSNLKRIFFGAYQEDIPSNNYGLEGYHAIELGRRFNPRIVVAGGVMRKECTELMKNIKNWTPVK